MAKMGRPRKESTEQNQEQLDTEEIVNRIKTFLEEKQKLDVPSCYMVAKMLTEDYWDEWTNNQEDDELDEDEEGEDFDIPDDEVPRPPIEFRKKVSTNPVLEKQPDGRIFAKPSQKQTMPPMPVI